MSRSLRRAALLAGALMAVAPAASQAGDVIYALAGTKLVRFNAATPGRIDKSIALTGLPAGVTLGGLDERPLTGGLYALGSTPRYTPSPRRAAGSARSGRRCCR